MRIMCMKEGALNHETMDPCFSPFALCGYPCARKNSVAEEGPPPDPAQGERRPGRALQSVCRDGGEYR